MFSSPLSCLLYSLYIFLGTRDPSLYLVVSSIGVVASLELITEIRELEDRSQDGSREEEIKLWRNIGIYIIIRQSNALIT